MSGVVPCPCPSSWGCCDRGRDLSSCGAVALVCWTCLRRTRRDFSGRGVRRPGAGVSDFCRRGERGYTKMLLEVASHVRVWSAYQRGQRPGMAVDRGRSYGDGVQTVVR
jgi:hypothetical protein